MSDENTQVKNPGMSPGTLVYTGKFKREDTVIELICYDEKSVLEKDYLNILDLEAYKFDKKKKYWINITGLNKIENIRKIGKKFNIDPLTLEDVLSIKQRPKVEEYKEYDFVVMKMIYLSKGHILYEQLSMVVATNFVLTFQERKEDIFHPIRMRLRNKNSGIRKRKTDYLSYAIIDLVVDHYFQVVDNIAEKVNVIENEVISASDDKDTSRDIFAMKQELVRIKKIVSPTRDLISTVQKTDFAFYSKENLKYFRDVYDHIVTVMELIDTQKDTLSNTLSLYHTNTNIRMTEAIKVLTVISTIFIPLTFIVGLYGMNFHYMPELSWKYGYLYVWAIMLIVAFGMVMFFKKKKLF